MRRVAGALAGVAFLALFIGCGPELPFVEAVPGPPKSSVAGSAAADPTYRLQPEDTINVAIFDHLEASGPQIVGRDGTIAFPLIGPVMVQGRTGSELRKDLARRYAAFIKDPDVSVSVTSAHGLLVYLLGEVGKPGELSLAGGSRLSQAIAEAGGYTDHAATSRMVVSRKTEDGKVQRIHVDIRDILEKGRFDQDIALQPGDMISVPRKPYPVGWQDWLAVLGGLNLILTLTLTAITLYRLK